MLRFCWCNRADKPILFVLLRKQTLLLALFVITIEIVATSEVKVIQLGFELFKAPTPYDLDFALRRKHGSDFSSSR